MSESLRSLNERDVVRKIFEGESVLLFSLVFDAANEIARIRKRVVCGDCGRDREGEKEKGSEKERERGEREKIRREGRGKKVAMNVPLLIESKFSLLTNFRNSLHGSESAVHLISVVSHRTVTALFEVESRIL